jgi:hypothetical protein
MPSYLVEVYLPRSRAHEARASGHRARTGAEQLAREGVPIRYIRTAYLPDDETCFHLFEARTPAAVEEAPAADVGSQRLRPATAPPDSPGGPVRVDPRRPARRHRAHRGRQTHPGGEG